ncbi:MAG: HTTM domain-containing protein [Nannocystis sp.]|nr:HTTM domain-containing protein [Nannocystis sp.]MBA3548253.1 HTTM domain-containing protein [Nannocystis sp.]
MRRLVETWRRFFYAPDATAPLDRFRRYLAVWTGAWALTHLPHARELYGRPILREGLADLVPGLTPPPLALVLVLSAGLVAALVLVLAGVRTRTATRVVAGCFAALVMLDASELLAYNGLALLQWTILALAPEGPVAPRWAARLVMLQLSTVYGFAALTKLIEGPAWRDGTAIARIFGSPRYGQHLVSNWLPPAEGAWPLALGWSVIALELFIAFGLWHRRTRAAAVIALVGLHVGMALTMRVSWLFHGLMLAHLGLFRAARAR